MRDRAEDAEAKMRACSARLADAVERSDREGSVPSRTLLDGDLRALLRDVEDAAAESFAARSALEEFWKTQTQPRAVSGFSTAPAPLERDSAFDDQLEAFLERHSAFDTFEEEEASGRKGSLPSKENPSVRRKHPPPPRRFFPPRRQARARRSRRRRRRTTRRRYARGAKTPIFSIRRR